MKAAILEKLNTPLIVDDISPDWDKGLGVGQVFVKVMYSGICGAQIGEIAGAKGEDRYLPHLMGHEGGGIVMDVGQGVTHVKSGDHVVLHWRKGAGIEAKPPTYKRGNGTVGGGWVTTFNEYAIISENRLTPIDKDIPLDVAALMGCAVTTALGLINNEAQLKIGLSIMVIGCGGVGLNIIQGAVLVGAGDIIAVDINPAKLDMAARFGATHIHCDIKNNLSPVDVVVDCTGIPECIELGYNQLSTGGKMVLVGQPRHDQKLTINAMRRHYCGQSLFDSQGGLTNPTIDIPRYLKLYKSGKLKLDELITHRYPLEQVNEALDMVRSGEAGRVVLEMNRGDD
jgi:Zn-dependent alcohol dehydrogenase